ncbi:MAG: hypothetical protein LBL58_18470 [Tannerellaceae bacterium]|jgi:hypothetical protein|nr:hypothetical protein [Tannerellaceae bacterium]
MENNSAKRRKDSVHMEALKAYKECLKTDPYLSFRSYCRDNNLIYEKILEWMNRRGIFIREFQAKAKGEGLSKDKSQPTFIRFRPQNHPVMTASILKGVSITYPNNISLTLQECTVESLVSLLSLYHPEK